MNVIFYGGPTVQPLIELKEVLEESLPKGAVDHRQSIVSLAKKLKQTGQGQSVVILFVSNVRELQECHAILSLLRKVRLILVLPQRNQEILQAGYRLEPRFIGFSDNGLANLQAVLLHMCLYRNARAKEKEDVLQMRHARGRLARDGGVYEANSAA